MADSKEKLVIEERAIAPAANRDRSGDNNDKGGPGNDTIRPTGRRE